MVLAVAADPRGQSVPRQDGAAETWQKLLKLRTTASVMHVTAHPDDEHGGVLAKLSRGDGARLALLTLNRGESGDNAIGPQLFDALGLIRTEELLNAALALLRRNLFTRLPALKGLYGDERRDEYKDAVRLLRDVADCKFKIIQAAAPAPSQVGAGTISTISSSPRVGNRAGLDGLV